VRRWDRRAIVNGPELGPDYAIAGLTVREIQSSFRPEGRLDGPNAWGSSAAMVD